MILLPPEIRAALRANAIAHHAAQQEGRRSPDPLPVVKLFNPIGAATWLATELDEDGSTLFGLADLGFGCPELGYFDLGEIESVRLPGGLGIERDLYFEPRFSLSAYAEAARIASPKPKPCCPPPRERASLLRLAILRFRAIRTDESRRSLRRLSRLRSPQFP